MKNPPPSFTGLWLLIIGGMITSLLPLVVYGLGCFSSGWQCIGDEMGGVMMLYALSFFLPNIIAYFIFPWAISVTVARNLSSLSKPLLLASIVYFGITLLSVYEIIFANLNHIEFGGKRFFLKLPYDQLDSSNLLVGSDVNGDHVRDDLEPIFAREPDPEFRKFKIEYAKSIFNIMASTDSEEVQGALLIQFWIQDCFYDWERFRHLNHDFIAMAQEIKMLNTNTYTRYLHYNIREHDLPEHIYHDLINRDPSVEFCRYFFDEPVLPLKKEEKRCNGTRH